MRIEGIPPAIAIDQTNPVRTSRSTVGTMTELNDHLKLLFARAAHLHCRGCGRPVRRDTPPSDLAEMRARAARRRSAARRHLPGRRCRRISRRAEVKALLEQQGYTRIHAQRGALEVVQDRLRAWAVRARPRDRSARSGAARRPGTGQRARLRQRERAPFEEEPSGSWRYSTDLHCADCDIHYQDPTPSLFSFNSPARRLRDVPRLRPRDRHRLRADRAGRSRRRCAKARSSRGRRPASTASARTTWNSTRRSAASRSTRRGANLRRTQRAGCSKASPNGKAGASPGPVRGTASRASSPGWKPRPTRCTSACCCRSTAPTPSARRAAARG
jgi:hypothetical protein